MKELRNGVHYRPSGELQGDDNAINDNGGATKGEYDKSLGEASKSDLAKGYCNKKSITGCTGSDKGFA